MAISNEFIQQILPTAKQYCIFIFTAGPKLEQPNADEIQWEHVRYLFQLREDGKLLVTCPVIDGGKVMGLGILNTSNVEEARSILNEDPNVKTGRLIYDVHLSMGFPGDGLK